MKDSKSHMFGNQVQMVYSLCHRILAMEIFHIAFILFLFPKQTSFDMYIFILYGSQRGNKIDSIDSIDGYKLLRDATTNNIEAPIYNLL